jgi:hypothetical protein
LNKVKAYEKQFEKSFMDKAEYIPNSFWMPKEAPGSVRGTPDRIGLINGRFVALEFKRTMKEMGHPREKLQRYTLDRVLKAGGYGMFVYPENAEMVLETLREMSNG